jgi:hypothetical protein
MKNRIGARRGFEMWSNRVTLALRRQACRAIAASSVAEAAEGDAATAGQIAPNRRFWSKFLENSLQRFHYEHLTSQNPALSFRANSR